MHKILQKLFLFEKFEIQTKLSKQEILKRIDSISDPEYGDYYAGVLENGFIIAEQNIKYFGGGRSQNSFAPVAKATMIEKDGMTVISVTLRMNLLVHALFLPIYILLLLAIFTIPIIYIIMHFAFFKPAKRLKTAMENLF